MADEEKKLNLTLHLDGLPENQGEVRLSVFVEKIDALREVLREADRLLARDSGISVDFFVEDLKKESPSQVKVREHCPTLIDERRTSASDLVAATVRKVTAGEAVNDSVFPILEKLKDLGDGFGRKQSRIWFSQDDEMTANFTEETCQNILELLKVTIRSFGSVVGRVERYNSHGKEKYFYIYPELGGRIKCNFDEALIDSASHAVEKTVIVHGNLRYREGQFQAHEVDVVQMEVMEPESNRELLSDMYGIAPQATGEESAVDFIKRMRNGWNQ